MNDTPPGGDSSDTGTTPGDDGSTGGDDGSTGDDDGSTGGDDGSTGGDDGSTGGDGKVAIPDPVTTFYGRADVPLSPDGLGEVGGVRIEGMRDTSPRLLRGFVLVLGHINDEAYWVTTVVDPRNVNGVPTEPSGQIRFFFPGEFIFSEEVLAASHFEIYQMWPGVSQATPVSLATLATLLDKSTLLGTVQGTEMVPVYF